ncbi:NB-ARC domains-containing protein [Tanacetum coccineum]
MKLRYCLYLTSTPDFTNIANLEELILEGCKNLVKVHPSIGMLKKLLVLNTRDCTRLKSFPSNLEMDSLKILILSGCLKMKKLPEDLGRIKSLTELHIDRTSITELPLFGQQESIRSRWWTAPFGLLSKQQHPQRSPSLAGFHLLKSLNFSYCNLVQIPESIGCLSCLERLDLEGNNYTILPGSLTQLSHLFSLKLDGCKELEVLPELPHSLEYLDACDCTSLGSITGSSKDPIMINRTNNLCNCPKLFTNVAIESQVLISETQWLESSITSQGSTNRISAFLEYAGIQNNRCEIFRFPRSNMHNLDIMYEGNSIPEWFTNKSMGSRVKVELPLDWSFSKLRGYGICVVFKRKIPSIHFGYSVENFDGAYLGRYDPNYYTEYFKGKPLRMDESDMIWLSYMTKYIRTLKEAKNFVTFCFDEIEDIEVKKMGVRLVCDEDSNQEEDIYKTSQVYHNMAGPRA